MAEAAVPTNPSVQTATAPQAESKVPVPGAEASSPPGAPQPGDVAAAAKEAIRKHKLKVDGQEVEVDDDELKRGYAHQKAANKRFQEAMALRKQNEEIVSKLRDKGTLQEILKKLGHDPRAMSEEILAGYLEDELMDPRDKELKEAKAKLRQIEDMEKRQKEALDNRRLEEVRNKYAKEYEEQFVAALEKSQLPPTKPMVAAMAKYIAQSAKIGFKMSADEAATLVREDIQLAHQRLIGDSDGEVLLKLLGEGVANKIRKYDTSKLKSPEQNLKTPEPSHNPRERRPTSGRMTAREWQLHKRGLK